ncbi:hypothetical protein Ccr29_gp197 [Caulobacter phage Ccr29]|nr:hypothetical protein Ccr29_gp197 [Caulobacter phage Ccr29]
MITCEQPDDRFPSQISHAIKVDYICGAIGLRRADFSLDVPLPYEDWYQGQDAGLIQAGYLFTALRHEFYDRVLVEHPELKSDPHLFALIALNEYWHQQFRFRHYRRDGLLVLRDRVLH